MRIIKLESLIMMIEKHGERERERERKWATNDHCWHCKPSHQGEQIKVVAMATIKPKRSHYHRGILGFYPHFLKNLIICPYFETI